MRNRKINCYGLSGGLLRPFDSYCSPYCFSFDVVLFDLHKASDSVPHHPQLKDMGLDDCVLRMCLYNMDQTGLMHPLENDFSHDWSVE